MTSPSVYGVGMSTPRDPRTPGVGDSRPFSERHRRPLQIIAAVTATAVVFTIAWFALAPAPAAPGPWDHAPMAVCSESEGTVLHADVDGDGHLDEVRDPDREGVITVEGGGDAWRTDLHDTLSRLVGIVRVDDPDRETRGTLGDFDGDGHVDLALFWSAPHSGDDPVEDMPIHEVHFGPLSRDLTSERVGPLRIDFKGFVYGIRAGDQNGDGRAELQVFQTAGDGGVDQRVGHYDDGGVTVDNETIDFHDTSSWRRTDLGWDDIETCSGE